MTRAKKQIDEDENEKQVEIVHEKKSNMAQSIFTGSVAGAVEVMVDHPLWTIKTRIQRGEIFTFKPNILYRGIVPNAASMIPITALQVGFNRGFQNLFFREEGEHSNIKLFASAFSAGVVSSFVSCPTERVMTYQSKVGGTFYNAASHLYKVGTYRYLFTGLPATAFREGGFTAFFLAVTPIVKEHINPFCPNDYVSSVLAGVGAGIGATVVSQGLDTIKTIQQAADIEKTMSFSKTAKSIYSQFGMHGFFKGGVPRGARVMAAVTIMSWVNEKMEKTFQEYNLKQMR